MAPPKIPSRLRGLLARIERRYLRIIGRTGGGDYESGQPLAGRALRTAILLAAGFFLGFLFFFPGQVIWPGMLRQAGVSWQGVEWASATGIRLTGVRYPSSRPVVFIPGLEMHLGINPLLHARVEAGGDITLELGWDRTLRFRGDLTPQVLFNNGLTSGVISLDGKIQFKHFDLSTAEGSARFAAQSLQLNGAISIFEVSAEGVLGQGKLTATGSVGRPIPVGFSADIHMQGAKTTEWPYAVAVTQPGGKQVFNRQGQLSDLFARGAAGLFAQ